MARDLSVEALEKLVDEVLARKTCSVVEIAAVVEQCQGVPGIRKLRPLIVEGDGRRWHTRRADHDRDRQRDNEATAHGYAVLRFTYEMLRDRPDECLEVLFRTGRVRSAS